MKAYDRQSLIDIAIVATGNADEAIDIAIQNGISITTDLTTNIDIKLTQKSNTTTLYFKLYSAPATAITTEQHGGIGYIGIDFIVS